MLFCLSDESAKKNTVQFIRTIHGNGSYYSPIEKITTHLQKSLF